MSISKKYSISIDKLLGNNIEENDDTSDAKLSYLQRGLGQMDEEQLKKAENMLKLVFDDIFDDEEGDDDAHRYQDDADVADGAGELMNERTVAVGVGDAVRKARCRADGGDEGAVGHRGGEGVEPGHRGQ